MACHQGAISDYLPEFDTGLESDLSNTHMLVVGEKDQ